MVSHSDRAFIDGFVDAFNAHHADERLIPDYAAIVAAAENGEYPSDDNDGALIDLRECALFGVMLHAGNGVWL